MSRSLKIRNIISLAPPAILVGLTVFFCLWHFWNGDSVLHQFVYRPMPEYFSWTPIRNAGQLWDSITMHYMEQNGRFFCHVIVMWVTSFMPKWLFAVISGIMLALLMWMTGRMAGIKADNVRGVLSLTVLCGVALDNLTDAAFYINYIWMGTIVMWWLMLFLRAKDSDRAALWGLGLYSLIAGATHECYALPIGFALTVYGVVTRFRISRGRLVAGLCFCLGGVTTIVSPGIWCRIDEAMFALDGDLSRFEMYLLTLIPAVFLWTLWRNRKRLGDFFGNAGSDNSFLLYICLGAVILEGATYFQYYMRAATIGSLAAIILVLRLSPGRRLNWVWTAFFLFMTVWLIQIRWDFTSSIRAKYTYAENVYSATRPDTLYMPDELYAVDSRLSRNMEEHVMRILVKREHRDGEAPERIFKALPASLKDVPRDYEGNMCRYLGGNRWLLIQSRKHPARFVTRKLLFPGVLDLHVIPDRELVFADNKDDFDIYCDSTATWIAAFYSLDVPLVKPEVIMTEQHEGE